MSHQVKVLVGGMTLPDGNTYFTANTIVTLTDAQYGQLSPTVFSSGRLQDMGVVANDLGMGILGFEPIPRVVGMQQEVKINRGGAVLVMGVCNTAATVTTLRASSRVVATTPTLTRMGIYSITGATATLVARTASNANLFTAGYADYAPTLDPTGGYPSSFNFVPGQAYGLALLVVGGTTDPTYFGAFSWGGISKLSPIMVNVYSAQTDLATSYGITNTATFTDMPWMGAI